MLLLSIAQKHNGENKMTILNRFIGERFVAVIIENNLGVILLETCSLEIAERFLKENNLLPIQADLLPVICEETMDFTSEEELAIRV